MNKVNKSLFVTLAIVVAVGFLAGVVGELWLNSFLLPDPYLNFKNYSDLSLRLDELIQGKGADVSLGQQDAAIEKAVSAGRPSVAGIYRYKNLSDKASSTLTPADFVASGAIVTNDGWIVTDRQIADSEKDKLWVSVGDKGVYLSEKVLLDSGLGLAMIKIKAENLAVVDFATRENLTVGQTVLLYGQGQRVVSSAIKDKSFARLSGPADYLRGSEQFSKYIQLSGGVNKEFIGSPIVTMSGKMAGVVADESGLVVPVDHFLGYMKAALENKKWVRPYLGLRFYDLSEVLNPAIADKRGALISANGIAEGSPAKGYLLPGDIILKVENDELNANKNLSEIVAQYPLGQTVKFSVKRGKDVIDASVKLR